MLKSLCSAAFSLTVLLVCAGLGLMVQGTVVLYQGNIEDVVIGVVSLIFGGVVVTAGVVTWLAYRQGGPWKEDVVDPPTPKPPVYTPSTQALNCPEEWSEHHPRGFTLTQPLKQMTFDDKLICSDKDKKENLAKEPERIYPPIKLLPGNKSGVRKQRFVDRQDFSMLWNDKRRTIYDIAWFYNVSTTSVCNWAMSWGLPAHTRKPKRTLDMEELIKALNHKGMKKDNRSTLWLCSELNVSQKTLNRGIEKLNSDQKLLARVYGEGH